MESISIHKSKVKTTKLFNADIFNHDHDDNWEIILGHQDIALYIVMGMWIFVENHIYVVNICCWV